MCGCFNIIDDPSLQALLKTLGVAPSVPGSMINVAPTEDIPVVTGSVGAREMRAMRWWLTPSWAPEPSTRYSMFNAKSETIATSRAFRGPFRRQRGIVPASSFIEWHSGPEGKQAWLIESEEAGALALAAIWDLWQRDGATLYSCCLITTAATSAFEPWHHRMPVMLRAADYDSWLDPQQALPDLDHYFAPSLPGPLRLSPLPRAVNNARNKAPEVLQPSAAGQVIRP